MSQAPEVCSVCKQPVGSESPHCTSATNHPVLWECSLCGHDGGPMPDCDLCHGNQHYCQTKAYTLSEERRMAAANPERYGRTGAVGPKIASVPGSGNPGNPMG